MEKDPTPVFRQPQQVKGKERKGIKNEKGKGIKKEKKENKAKKKEAKKGKDKEREKRKGIGFNTPTKSLLKRKLEEQQTNNVDLEWGLIESPLQNPKMPKTSIEHSPLPITSPQSEQISHQKQQSLQQQVNPLPLQQQKSKLQELMEKHDHLHKLIKECRKQDSQCQLPQLLSTINALDLQISKELGISRDQTYTIPYEYDDISSLEENDFPPLEDDSE